MRLWVSTIVIFVVLFASVGAVSVSEDVQNAIEENDTIRVIVSVRDTAVVKSQGKGKGLLIAQEEIDVNNVKTKHVFTLSNAFAAEVTAEGLVELQNNPHIVAIEIDKPVSVSLQDSVPLINATVVHDLIFNGTNITGVGQTVCVIDTGVNYTHPDLGRCNINQRIHQVSI